MPLKSPKFLRYAACGLLAAACGQPPSGEIASGPPPVPDAKPEPVKTLPAAPVTAETRATYQWYCAQCHGAEGRGDGINAKFLAVPPRDHTQADYLETRSDEELFQTIRMGGLAAGRAPCMPAWGHTLDEATMRSLVRYIRELCRCEAV
jgi:mono/diheme cytochrome c family protein